MRINYLKRQIVGCAWIKVTIIGSGIGHAAAVGAIHSCYFPCFNFGVPTAVVFAAFYVDSCTLVPSRSGKVSILSPQALIHTFLGYCPSVSRINSRLRQVFPLLPCPLTSGSKLLIVPCISMINASIHKFKRTMPLFEKCG